MKLRVALVGFVASCAGLLTGCGEADTKPTQLPSFTPPPQSADQGKPIVKPTGPSERKMPPSDPKKEVKTKSGLVYEDMVVGKGQEAHAGDLVAVHYTGWLKNGTEFDSSLTAGKPLEFRLQTGGMIKGFDEGVTGMKVGGVRRLGIPSKLAYGEAGRGKIPPDADLVFEVELVKIK